MLAFVDESGDAGLKVGAGSSKYFVVALVVFDDHSGAHVADEGIAQLRKDGDLHPHFEVRFNKCRKDLRVRFLSAMASHEFFYSAVVIDKESANLGGEHLTYRNAFYEFANTLVLRNASMFLRDAIVTIDGSGSRDFRRQLGGYLRRSANDEGQRVISRVRIQDSARNNLLRLADMVAGAIHRSFGAKQDANLYRSLLNHREKDVFLWPE